MRRLLWIGDAACPSGFARCTHEILETLRQTWEIVVLGLNYRGDPHPYPYEIYPCIPGGDPWGLGRIPWLLHSRKPDLVVVQNDSWNYPVYLKRLEGVPTVGFVAVDGTNCKGTALNGLELAIFWTDFAAQEARAGGYTGPSAIVPLGVDTRIFRPRPQQEARKALNFPDILNNAFIVGNVNRNQPRKRLDLMIMYFAEWIKTRGIDDAFLFLHIAPTGDVGFDCTGLAKYLGISNKLIAFIPPVFYGVSEDQLSNEYNAMNAMLTTTQGEGFGLTTLEGMACGIPQIVPNWSGLGDWTEDAVIKIPCTTFAAAPYGTGAIGGLADKAATIEALDLLYTNEVARRDYANRALRHARKPKFNWGVIGKQFADALESVSLKEPELAHG